MASALMELMKPEVEKYAEEYAKEYARFFAQRDAIVPEKTYTIDDIYDNLYIDFSKLDFSLRVPCKYQAHSGLCN